MPLCFLAHHVAMPAAIPPLPASTKWQTTGAPDLGLRASTTVSRNKPPFLPRNSYPPVTEITDFQLNHQPLGPYRDHQLAHPLQQANITMAYTLLVLQIRLPKTVRPNRKTTDCKHWYFQGFVCYPLRYGCSAPPRSNCY